MQHGIRIEGEFPSCKYMRYRCKAVYSHSSKREVRKVIVRLGCVISLLSGELEM